MQAASGSTFGIVPYVDPKNNGAVYGAVGAGKFKKYVWRTLITYLCCTITESALVPL